MFHKLLQFSIWIQNSTKIKLEKEVFNTLNSWPLDPYQAELTKMRTSLLFACNDQTSLSIQLNFLLHSIHRFYGIFALTTSFVNTDNWNIWKSPIQLWRFPWLQDIKSPVTKARMDDFMADCPLCVGDLMTASKWPQSHCDSKF